MPDDRRPITLLHTADIHIGVDTYGRLDAETGMSTRMLDFQAAFDEMVARAIAEDVDLFVFAGDAYRTADPTPTQQRLFVECLQPVLDAGIPVVMVVGNHDHPVSHGKASALDIFPFLDGTVHLYNRPGGPHRIETKRGPVQIIALPWPIRSLLLSKEEYRGMTPPDLRDLIEAKYREIVRTAAAEADPAVPLVVVGHFSVVGASLGGSERTSLIAHEPKFLAADLAQPGVDYVALGHIHRHQDLNPPRAPGEPHCPVVYSSSIERISFKEMDDDKGFVLVRLDADKPPGERAAYTFVATNARRFVSVTADARTAVDATDAVLAAIARADIAGAVVRVRYAVVEGQTVDATRLREALKDAYAIAAVERVADVVERQRRTVVTRELSLRDALDRYVSQREDLAPVRERLVAAALEIADEGEDSEEG